MRFSMAPAAPRSLRSGSRRSRRRSKISGRRRLVACVILIIPLFLAANLVYQITRKPAELLAPISGSFLKSPSLTWGRYGSLFMEYATPILSPTFLAALAQVESDGNPIARPRWRWAWSWDPFELYKPASSALGIFQITDGTFAEARKSCLTDGADSKGETFGDPAPCGNPFLYTRISARDSIEMTAAYLHRQTARILALHPKRKPSAAQKEKLAAVIHLCGAKRGEQFAARGFRVAQDERCGSHDLQSYLKRIDRLKTRFARLADN
jgi:hypothetical protein